jgi:hypothetical protein
VEFEVSWEKELLYFTYPPLPNGRNEKPSPKNQGKIVIGKTSIGR